jgi:hypothetical protein
MSDKQPKQDKNELLPDGQMNVLVDNGTFFAATNLANPRRWKKIINANGGESYVPE